MKEDSYCATEKLSHQTEGQAAYRLELKCEL